MPIHMEAVCLAAEKAVCDGHMLGRRVRIVSMKARLDLLNKRGKAIERKVSETDVRYTVVLDGGAGTITTPVCNLELVDARPCSRVPASRPIGGDELELVLERVLFRPEGFGQTKLFDEDSGQLITIPGIRTVTIPHDEESLRAAGKLTTDAARFAALSSVNAEWLTATMACASARLAMAGLERMSIVELDAAIEEVPPLHPPPLHIQNCAPQERPVQYRGLPDDPTWTPPPGHCWLRPHGPQARLKGRALMMRRLASVAATKPMKPVKRRTDRGPSEDRGLERRTRRVQEAHEVGRAKGLSHARAGAGVYDAMRGACVTPAWVPRA